MTCEQGKERKCQREGLEIINHYFSRMVGTKGGHGDDGDGDGKGDGSSQEPPPQGSSTLSLEEELKQLQSNNDPQSDSTFGIFETGCRGTVFALCTVPGSEMIPSIKEQKKKSSTPEAPDNDASGEESKEADEPEAKRIRAEKENSPSDDKETSQAATTSASTGNPEWDPVPIVRQIFQDAENDTAKDAPSSRFVTRMIPIQVTCYASEEELQIASRSLMQQYLPPSTTTFAVALKRRFCPGQLTKEKIINTVAAEVQNAIPKIKVNLSNPDVTVVVEICKTMCGISVIPKCHEHFQNFNLAVARDEHNNEEDEE